MSQNTLSDFEIRIVEINQKLKKQQELTLEELKILFLNELHLERAKENNS